MAFINQAVGMNVSSALDIFSTLPVQTSVESGTYQSYRPVTSISNNGPIEFVVSGSSNDEYIELGRVYLHVKAKIRTAEIPAAGNVAAARPVVGPVNNWLHSMFSQVNVYLNQKCITPPSGCYHYRALLESILNYSSEAKESHLTCSLFSKDTAGNMESTAAANAGFTTRRAIAGHDRVVDLYGPLHCDLFNTNKYLINGVEMSVKLQRAPNQFHLMGPANHTTTFEILDAELYVRKAKIDSSIVLAHHRALSVASAKYPITRVDVKTITIPADTTSKSMDNIYIGVLPKRCIIGFVRTDAFNGSYTLNPYNFQHFGYTQLSMYLDSVSIPSKPFICDFANNQYIRAYNSLFEGTNINHSDTGNNISRQDYPNGYALVAIDLTPDLSASADHISLPKTGSLRLDVQFSAPLANSVTAIIFSEFDSLITVDKNRSVVTDYSS